MDIAGSWIAIALQHLEQLQSEEEQILLKLLQVVRWKLP